MSSIYSRCYEIASWYKYRFSNLLSTFLSLCAHDLGLSVQYVSHVVNSYEFTHLYPSLYRAIKADIKYRLTVQCAHMRSRKARNG